jgi:uncharacterized membrane protein
MFSDFPNLHPLVVHFPVVLLLVAAALQTVLVFKDWPQVRWMALVAMAGGFAGGLAASTIFHAMPKGLPPKAAAIFAAHEQYASYTLWLAGITLLLAGVGEFFQIRRRAYAGLVLASALAAAGAVSVAGHHGAQLVYVEGVGPKGNLVMSEEEEAREEKASMEGMDMGSPAGNKQAGANPKMPTAADAAGKQSTAGMERMQGMEGMDMSGTTASPPAMDNGQTDNSMPAMGNMKMAEKSGPGTKKAAPATGSMTDMQGMKSKKPQPKEMANMPGMAMEGMDMPATPAQRAKQTQPAMPGMDMNKGVGKQPAGARKQPPMQGMAGMEGMGGMPGMKAPASGKQPPAPEMGAMPGMEKGQAMPGMGTMPGMTMPSPMDKYRFEDNNPARTIPPRNERKQDN